MKFRTSTLALVTTATLLAFNVNQIVHADSARQEKIAQLDRQKAEIIKANGIDSFTSNGGWYAITQIQDKIASLEQTVSSLKNPYSNKNTIKVSREYATALKTFFNSNVKENEKGEYVPVVSDEEEEQAKKVLISESQKLKQSQLDNFISDPADELDKYELNNLPKDILVELNYYALDLMNQIRRQMGLPEVTLAQSSIDFADKVAYKNLEANRSMWDWHYVKGINEVAREYGLRTSSKNDEEEKYGGQYYENAFKTSSIDKEVTVGQLKKEIYEAFVIFLYNGDEFLHAQSIAGVNYGSSRDEYFGISMRSLKDGGWFSFISIDKNDIVKSTKKNFNTQRPVDTTLTNRSSLLAKKEKELRDKKNELSKLQTAFKEYEKLTKEVNDLKLLEEKEKKEAEDRRSSSQNQNKPQSKPVKNGWKKENDSWYYYKDNQRLKNTWQGDYWLGADGKMVKSAWVDNGRYYVDDNGKYVVGKKPSTQSQTKPSQSKPVKNGWQKESGSWYYYDNDQRVKNTWKGSYYLKSDGRMAESEWIYDNSYKAWYYLKSNGIYVRDSWQGSYYLKSNGKMADKEWIYDNYYQSWFYLKEGGAYVNHQWLKIDGVWYYFKSGGYMVSNAWQGSYYLKSSGAMAVNEWIYDSYWGGWYYLKSDGSYARNEIVQGKYRVDYSGKWI